MNRNTLTSPPTDTGELLLMLISGNDTTATLLKKRGLTATRLRTFFQRLESEPPLLIDEVTDKASQIASSLNLEEPTSLHQLSAISSVRQCHAFRAFEDFGLDPQDIHSQALRCLTGTTTERTPGETQTARESLGAALPLAKPLLSISSAANPPVKMAQEQVAPIARPKRHQKAADASTLINAGQDLEKMQRKTRAGRSGGSDQDTAEQVDQVDQVDAPPAKTDIKALELCAKQFPTLASMGRNLTMEAALGELDTIIGRDHEMERMADVLNKRRANSPCLIGAAGVGKTAVVEGLASRLAFGDAPGLDDKIVVEIRPSDLLSGTSFRGALSERLAQIKQEVANSNGKIILFFDEFHALLASNDGTEAVQELKAALGRGELPCIAATTEAEYNKYIVADPALARRFTPIEIGEPTEEDAIKILSGVKPIYADHHGVDFDHAALEAAVKLSSRYVTEGALPDKAITLLDLAGARARRARAFGVEADDVAHVLAEQLGIPPERLVAGDKEKLLNIENDLAKKVIGHKHALTALGETLRRNGAGFRSGRPIGSFLFLGPTGVGKTETAKALSNLLFPDGDAMIRLDMSEFSEAHAVARLVGAPPGYIGHDEGGQLTEAVRRRPYSLVLLDEIEKAHRDVLQVLLQVLDDGRLTDGSGRTVNFQNTVLVLTSNLGSDLRQSTPQPVVGFGAKATIKSDPSEDKNLVESIKSSARDALPPELWNRIDEPMVFAPLSREEVSLIARLMLDNISGQLEKEHRITIELEDNAIEALILGGGFDPQLGARPMRRTVQRMVEGPIAKMVLCGQTKRGDVVKLKGHNGNLEFEILSENKNTQPE